VAADARPAAASGRAPALESLLRVFVAPPPPAIAAVQGEDPPVVSPRTDPSAAEGPTAPLGAAPPRLAGAAPRIAVLGAAADVGAVAWALAAMLTAGRDAPPGVVATWSAAADGAAGRPRTAAAIRGRARATRLAAALADRGHHAHRTGRLVEVRLGEEADAVAHAARLPDVAGVGALVLALAGARAAGWDALLREQDLIVLAAGPGVPEALLAVAAAASRERCPAVPAAVVAVSGGRRPRPSRHQVAAVLDLLDPR